MTANRHLARKAGMPRQRLLPPIKIDDAGSGAT
jgi:hypothetical protein